jgi:uncharacterized membrane protein YphA (DoxX/SURF4 family)
VTTTTAGVTARESRPRRVTSTLLWAGQILLAAFFLLMAAPGKLTGDHQMVREFHLIGAGQWFRYLVGTFEVIGAIGLLTPRLAGPAAPGWPPPWLARPSSTPLCCATPRSAATSG